MENSYVDLFVFAGQSNMAGRGDRKFAPKVQSDRAFEYRAISAPHMLHPVEEPFGYLENNPEGIDEPDMKKVVWFLVF